MADKKTSEPTPPTTDPEDPEAKAEARLRQIAYEEGKRGAAEAIEEGLTKFFASEEGEGEGEPEPKAPKAAKKGGFDFSLPGLLGIGSK